MTVLMWPTTSRSKVAAFTTSSWCSEHKSGYRGYANQECTVIEEKGREFQKLVKLACDTTKTLIQADYVAFDAQKCYPGADC